MRIPGRGRLTRRTATATAAALAVVVAGGGYALASTGASGPAPRYDSPSLIYRVGHNVSVGPHMSSSNAELCPLGTYPIGGGPSSARAVWELQWSDADRSYLGALHPNEWTVGLYNNSGSYAAFKVFVVCSTARSVGGNY